MYGLIAKIYAQPGKRDELAELVLSGSGDMPGCLSYIVAKCAHDADLIWVTEVWDSEESHKASLALPAVKEAIGKAMPLVAGFEQGATTEPVGGIGLKRG
jgi:quinol monooxygenase YgiN